MNSPSPATKSLFSWFQRPSAKETSFREEGNVLERNDEWSLFDMAEEELSRWRVIKDATMVPKETTRPKGDMILWGHYQQWWKDSWINNNCRFVRFWKITAMTPSHHRRCLFFWLWRKWLFCNVQEAQGILTILFFVRDRVCWWCIKKKLNKIYDAYSMNRIIDFCFRFGSDLVQIWFRFDSDLFKTVQDSVNREWNGKDLFKRIANSLAKPYVTNESWTIWIKYVILNKSEPNLNQIWTKSESNKTGAVKRSSSSLSVVRHEKNSSIFYNTLFKELFVQIEWK